MTGNEAVYQISVLAENMAMDESGTLKIWALNGTMDAGLSWAEDPKAIQICKITRDDKQLGLPAQKWERIRTKCFQLCSKGEL